MSSVIRGSDNFDSKPYASFPIGVPFAIWDHFAPVLLPDNSGSIKFIKLTANDSYNDGLLTNETVSGSAPLVEATAEIDVGPLVGLTVHLLNTEEAVVRARGTSGALQMDQMQRITGRIDGNNQADAGIFLGTGTEGAFSTDTSGSGRAARDGTVNRDRFAVFNSANSPDARASSTTDGETRAKNVSATYYMRVA
jgi:hypothetical protein